MAERVRYLVSYDICDPKRLRTVAKTCEGFGYRIQYSVFECALDVLRKKQLEQKLHAALNHDEDQVLFIRLGVEGSAQGVKIEAMGVSYSQQPRVTVI